MFVAALRRYGLITGEPISTITDIDFARCGLIEVHLAYHRNGHGRADINFH